MPDIREDQYAKVWALLSADDPEKRLSGIEVLSKIDVEWPVAWLALMLADTEAQVAHSAYQALRRRGPSVLPLLSLQLLSPNARIRQASIRMIGEFGDLSALNETIPALFDPVVDVREEGRKVIENLVGRSLDKAAKDPRHAEVLADAMRLFASLSVVSQRNVRSVIVSSLLALSVEAKALFWEIYPELEVHATSAIEHDLLSRPNPRRVELLYYGLSVADDELADGILRILERLLTKDSVSDHIESLGKIPPAKRTKALLRLSEKGLIGSYFEYFPWVRRDIRIPFLRLFQDDLGQKYYKHLHDLLEEANPLLAATLIENFLTFERELPLLSIQKLLKNSSPVVRRSGIQYLHFRGGAEHIRLLMAQVQDEDPQTAKLAVRATSRIARDYIVDHFGRIGEHERRTMTRVLQKIDPDFIDSLIDLMGGLDEEDRIHLALILAEASDLPEASRVVEDMLEDVSERIRATAVRGLENMDPERMDEETIARLFRDPDPRVRANLIESLPLERKAQWVENIQEATRSNTPRERANAIRALFDLGHTEAEIALMQMLRHPDSWMRTSGLWILGQVDAPHLLGKAFELCDDPHPHVRVHALRALGKKGTPELVRRLTPYLNDPSDEVREAAQFAIKAQTGFDYRGS